MACTASQGLATRTSAAALRAAPVCAPHRQRRAAPGPAAVGGRAHACTCTCAASSSAHEACTTASPLSWVLARQQQQQHQQFEAPQQVAAAAQQQRAAAVGSLRAPPPPMAALRLLLTGQNNTIQKALSQGPKGGGPISLLLFALTLIAACFAALRNALVRKVRGCKCCRGYGVIRCRLCDGEGRVDWAAKLSHFDACPLCMNRRYIVCSDCGGGYQRPLFSHARRRGPAQDESSDVYTAYAAAGAGIAVGAAVGAGAAGSAGSAAGSAVSSLDLSDGISSARND
jgi:hypothetical protein